MKVRYLAISAILAGLLLPASVLAYQCAVDASSNVIQCGEHIGAPGTSTVYDLSPSTVNALATTVAGPNGGVKLNGITGPDGGGNYTGTPVAIATPAPTATPASSLLAGAAMGASPPSITVTFGNGWTRGRVQFGTGTSATTGAVMTFTYPQTYSVVPFPQLEPGNAATAALGLFITNPTTSGATINTPTALQSSQTGTKYEFWYMVTL